jgi:hypothetical protein
VVYAATAEALYRSTDSCATFKRQTIGLPGRYLNWATQDRSGNVYVATQPAEDLFLTRLTADGKSAVFSTYLGTWESDIPADVAVDPTGDIWVTGYSRSADWPTTESALQKSRSGRGEDVFLTRLSAAGDSIVYSTYLGGSEAEGATALAVTPEGDVCVAGITYSADFPLVNAIQDKLRMQDGFIACITAEDGRMSFGTYLGGAGRDWIYALKADRAGNLYVAGATDSPDLSSSPKACQPQFSGGRGEDAFVAKIRPSRQ